MQESSAEVQGMLGVLETEQLWPGDISVHSQAGTICLVLEPRSVSLSLYFFI